jgi:hypothetical protein
VNPRVRFEDEADAEYRLAGRYYEERRDHLGIEFFDAVDATINRIVNCLKRECSFRGWRRTCSFVGALWRASRITSSISRQQPRFVSSPLRNDRRKPGYWEDRLKRSR